MWSTQLGRTKRTALASLLLCVLLWSPVSAQTIHPVQEDGRTVFVNDGTVASGPASRPAGGNSPAFEYWSNTERRWKPLPPASSGLLRRARVAAAEVQSFVQARPAAKPAPEKPATPNSQRQTGSHGSNSAEIDRIIEEAAARHHVDANLVRAVIKVESNFNPAAVSRRGAMGLMQLMPATARKFNVSNPFDPRQNVEAGVQHLKRLLDNFGGNVGLTLAAYNAGEAAVNRNNGIPPYPETRQYVRQIKGFYGGETSTLISSAPIRVSRDAFGVLTITNVE
jgi:soluble lytic murein transglycosylase-like protein